MAGLDVEKWDVRLDSREDATVILEAGVKWDRAAKLCVAVGGVV
jgi:hypothetical protein